MTIGWRIALASFVGFLPACGGDDDGDDDNVVTCEVTPGAWVAEGFDTNAAGALALRDAIADLQGGLNTAEQQTWGDTPMTAPTLAEIQQDYEAGSPSIASMTASPLDAIVRQTFSDWVDAMAQDPSTYQFIDQNQWVAAGAGGLHERTPAGDGTRRFRAYSAGGAELRQIVDKGLFVGTLYAYALSLTEGEITPATVHALAAAWGSNPKLVATPDEGEPGLEDSANYARTMGLFDETADALIAAQAYAGSAACTTQRDAALVEFFGYWEEAAFARGTYYAHAPVRATLDPSDPNTILDPLHGATEGYGLIVGLLGLSAPTSGPLAGRAKIASDADIRSALEAVGLDLADLSAGDTGQWLTEAPNTYNQDGLAAYKTIVQPIFGWNDTQFETYAHSPEANE